MDAEFTRWSRKIVNMIPANCMHLQIFWLSNFEPDQTRQYYLLKHWNIKMYFHQICIGFLMSLVSQTQYLFHGLSHTLSDKIVLIGT